MDLTVKRFLKVFTLLVISLLLLATGVDATLDRLAHAPDQNSFTWYSAKGDAVVAYEGPAALAQAFGHPAHGAATGLLHRT
jgi:hypothetical protein